MSTKTVSNNNSSNSPVSSGYPTQGDDVASSSNGEPKEKGIVHRLLTQRFDEASSNSAPETESVPETTSSSPKTPKPLTGRTTTAFGKLTSSGKDVSKIFFHVVPNSEITTDSGSSPTGIVSKGRQEIAAIRQTHDIPHTPDPLLEEIFSHENQIIKSIAESTPEETAEVLKKQEFAIAFQDGVLTVWKAPTHHSRVFTDNNNFKGQLLLSNVEKLPVDSQVTLKDLNESINKICTSIDNNKGALFCGMNEGFLVYLAPQSHPICAHMCDVLSITEFWDKSKETEEIDITGRSIKMKPFEVSRQYGWGYYLDQNKYQLGHDWIRQVRNEYIQELETLLTQEGLTTEEQRKINVALDTLRQKPVSILKKELVTEQVAQTELELQLETLVKIGQEFSQFAETEMHKTLQSMQKTVNVFAKHKDVIARSVVKQPISVWGVDKDKLLKEHPLVSLPKKLTELRKDARALGLEDLDFDIAELDPDKVQDFLQSYYNRDRHFDRNVGSSCTSYSTVTDAIEANKQFKAKTIGKLKELQAKVVQKHPNDPQAKKIDENCSKLIDEISKMYTEIQFYTIGATGDKAEMPVSGFGFKEALVKEAMSENYTKDYSAKEREYNAQKAEKAEAAKQSETLKTNLKDLEAQHEKTTEPREKEQIKIKIDKCKEDQAGCQANINALQKKISLFESVKLTRDMIEECHKRSIPCFVHYGPS